MPAHYSREIKQKSASQITGECN